MAFPFGEKHTSNFILSHGDSIVSYTGHCTLSKTSLAEKVTDANYSNIEIVSSI